MTKAEWIECVELMRGLWPSYQPDEGAVKASYGIAVGLDRGEVAAAIQSLSHEGGEFAPPVGKIAKRIQDAKDRTNLVPFADAMRLLVKAVHHAKDDERKALEFLEERSPAVARWVAAYGYHDLRMEPVASPDKGSMVRARLERSYDDSCQSYREERSEGYSLTQGRILQLGGGGKLIGAAPVVQAALEQARGEDAA